MTDDDNLLDEIFHEARKALKDDSSDEQEDHIPESWTSWENLNINASTIWKQHDDSFKFACRKIKTRAKEIEKRLNRVTSADILASLKVFVNSSDVKGVRSDDDVPRGPDTKKRVRFLFPQETQTDPSDDKQNKVESLLHRIQHWTDPSKEALHPNIAGTRNKILSAYWDAVRVVGQGRMDSETTFYNNPFDPRLRFDGLAHHVCKFDGQHSDNKPGGNVLLCLNKVSDVVDEYLQKYTKFLKSLRQESNILREAAAKHEAASNASSSKLFGCEFGPCYQGYTDLSEEEERLIEKLRSVRKLWDECAEVQGNQIPRRITARKPGPLPKRRISVMSEIKPSPWPTASVHTEANSPMEPTLKGILRKTKVTSPVEPYVSSGDPSGNERNSPRLWQRIAEEHIDQESLKHLRNATKERAGVKIMRPTPSLNETVSKTDSWAARVAQHVYTTSNTYSKSHSYMTQVNTCMSKPEGYKPLPRTHFITTRKNTAPHLGIKQEQPTGFAGEDEHKAASPQHDVTSHSVNETRGSQQEPEEQKADEILLASQKPVVSHQPEEPIQSAKARFSELNPQNASPDWLRRLIAKSSARSAAANTNQTNVEITTTTHKSNTHLSQSLKAPFVSTSTSGENKSTEQAVNSDKDSHPPPPTVETRCRVPPGFEKTVLEAQTGVPPPTSHQVHRTLHVPPTQQWHAPGAVYSGVNGETFIQQATGFHSAPRVIHQFQRPVAHVGGNIAIWQPRHPNYMITDANGKAVGVGIPGWNRVDIPPRPHVLVHQSQIPAAALRATVRQPPIFPTGSNATATNTDNYTQQTFSTHMPPQAGHLAHIKPQELPASAMANGPTNGYDRGDHFSGFAGSVQAPQMNYQNRMMPQFIPGMQHAPPIIQEYALFAPNQHKPQQTFVKQQQSLSQNSNNNNVKENTSTDIAAAESVDDLAKGSDKKAESAPIQETKHHKLSRAIRPNLIHLA